MDCKGPTIARASSSPTAPVFKWLPLFARHEFEELAWHFFTRVVRVAALEHVRLRWCGVIYKRHGPRWSAGVRRVEFVDLPLQRA